MRQAEEGGEKTGNRRNNGGERYLNKKKKTRTHKVKRCDAASGDFRRPEIEKETIEENSLSHSKERVNVTGRKTGTETKTVFYFVEAKQVKLRRAGE